MLKRTKLTILSPAAMNLPDEEYQRANIDPTQRWSGWGTFKEQTARQSTSDLGQAAPRTAKARSTSIPRSLMLDVGWVVQYGGRNYTVTNWTRTGKLVSLDLQETARGSSL